MPLQDFKDFDKWQYNFYVEIENISKYHEFTFGESEQNTTTIGCKIYCDAPKLSFNTLPSNRTGRSSRNYSPQQRKAKLLTMYEDLAVVRGRGMSEQKQCEMYFKWRPMIPEEYRDALCPQPSEEAMERHRKFKEEKRQMRNNMERDRLQDIEAGHVTDNLDLLDNDV